MKQYLQKRVGEGLKGNKKLFMYQPMRILPGYFFSILSTLLNSLCPEEIGSPFSLK